jgi:predicted methyltransferase
MIADKNFPVNEGTVIKLSCKVGYQLEGDSTVTCNKNTEFQYSTETLCSE